ncbi:cobalt-precorrin-6A reductase [Rhodococcoides yunnanense]|uniref:cobalt-precorrin-6A reductase n=1 Tax=Rhodococcoides yunnanense TaxID=278209 RepID=UPI000A866ED8|nr:cobalt-precorrin-6A reductase [Rhodococcus yunnanensis]
MKVLILGGTSEARLLAEAVNSDKRFDVVSSLAGRVRDPVLPAGASRVGGFGGAVGMTSWIRENGVVAVVDATHPFAESISRNASAAAAQASVPIAVLRRPQWTPGAGDNWIAAQSTADAAAIVAAKRQRVFLTIGRQGVDAFAGNTVSWFLVRSIDPPTGALPAHHELLSARGPFAVDSERALMRTREIDMVVSKNSGGAMTEAKLVAARELGLAVVMIDRPHTPPADVVTDSVSDVVTWLGALARGT